MNLQINTNGSEISVIKDPFIKECVTDICIYYRTTFNEPYWYGNVEFKNGNTQGKQNTPHCDTVEEVLNHIKGILDTIKQKQ